MISIHQSSALTALLHNTGSGDYNNQTQRHRDTPADRNTVSRFYRFCSVDDAGAWHCINVLMRPLFNLCDLFLSWWLTTCHCCSRTSTPRTTVPPWWPPPHPPHPHPHRLGRERADSVWGREDQWFTRIWRIIMELSSQLITKLWLRF